ncbi:hypothetical protein COCON_G00099770 [Conger conger]|uniref:Uncharacterized protein n=1 Tax=Conger conger TaxID=82655 RepID=A0A9Q1DMM6_CONCO|nr:hypothetical protein COCON_G00099770 [Conger conger]
MTYSPLGSEFSCLYPDRRAARARRDLFWSSAHREEKLPLSAPLPWYLHPLLLQPAPPAPSTSQSSGSAALQPCSREERRRKVTGPGRCRDSAPRCEYDDLADPGSNSSL